MNTPDLLYAPKTIYEIIYTTMTNQDFQQHTNMVISVSLELYRVLVSSLLLLFIPQSCGDNICELTDNLNNPDRHYQIGFIINWITMATFFIMYAAEIRREEKLIKLLEVNNTISTDDHSVGRRLNIFPEYKKQQLFQVDKHYQYISYIASVVFIVNTIYSWQVIYIHSLGNQTLMNFVTNILFMVSKMTNVIGIINTDKNVFFSAYLNTKVQFNDIDPREIEKIKRLSLKEVDSENATYSIEMVDGGGFCLIEHDSC
jgi:hypothetical protein